MRFSRCTLFFIKRLLARLHVAVPGCFVRFCERQLQVDDLWCVVRHAWGLGEAVIRTKSYAGFVARSQTVSSVPSDENFVVNNNDSGHQWGKAYLAGNVLFELTVAGANACVGRHETRLGGEVG